MVLRKSFYIHWSAGRSPRVHEVNPGRGPSLRLCLISEKILRKEKKNAKENNFLMFSCLIKKILGWFS